MACIPFLSIPTVTVSLHRSTATRCFFSASRSALGDVCLQPLGVAGDRLTQSLALNRACRHVHKLLWFLCGKANIAFQLPDAMGTARLTAGLGMPGCRRW